MGKKYGDEIESHAWIAQEDLILLNNDLMIDQYSNNIQVMINYLIKFNEDANEINLYIQCELKDEITQVDIEPYIHFHDNKKFFVFVEGYLLDNLTTKDIIDALVANSRQPKFDGSYNIFIHDYELKNFSLYRDFWGSRTLYMYKKDELNNFSSRISVIRKLYQLAFL